MPDRTEFERLEEIFEARFNPLMLRILNPTLLRLNWNTFIRQIRAEKLAVWNSLQSMHDNKITYEDDLLYIFHKDAYDQLEVLFQQLLTRYDVINNTGFNHQEDVANQKSRQTFRRARRTFHCIKRDTHIALQNISGELADLKKEYKEREDSIQEKILENFIVSNHDYKKLYIKSRQNWNRYIKSRQNWNRTKQTDDDYANQVDRRREENDKLTAYANQVDRRREENDKLTALETATNTYLEKRKTLVANLKKGASKGRYKLKTADIRKWQELSRRDDRIFDLNDDTKTIEFRLPKFLGVWNSWTGYYIQQLRNQTQKIKSDFKKRLDDCRQLVDINAPEEIKYYHPHFQPLRF